jgi:hypothetical protein
MPLIIMNFLGKFSRRWGSLNEIIESPLPLSPATRLQMTENGISIAGFDTGASALSNAYSSFQIGENNWRNGCHQGTEQEDR